tara:strand:+ start:817 stop:1197 length:381 start_codon:yes stop_codon:yes gene_type:complete
MLVTANGGTHTSALAPVTAKAEQLLTNAGYGAYSGVVRGTLLGNTVVLDSPAWRFGPKDERAAFSEVLPLIYDKGRGENSLLEKCVKQYDNSFLLMRLCLCLCLAPVIFASKDNGISLLSSAEIKC